ncbi:ATG C terminal domain-containing protein [Xylariales sp. AK1849]|nr:ATG C terminal domain-containing protein [Xylariales sp. AK1849]
MAAIFRSFGSSNMSKRLLRYALSRLEFLDTDALDMDKLDLVWGKNNVLTFQDVGIKLQKLERLLQLPSSFKLQKAKVLKLRVSIPSAIYSSPIIVEVDGVQVQLKVASEESLREEQRRPRSRRSTKTTEEEDIVPHAIDLAQSFLETQPSTEKAELQAALEAENQDLAASVATSSEDGSDDEIPMGTGQALSLPMFLADFLQGIVDRTQISIKGITFQLDVEVPVEVHSTTPELVSFRLVIDDISVEGVTTQVPQVETLDQERPAVVHKDGKRHISLNKIRASLISETNVFSTLSRTPSMPSSVATNSPVLSQRSLPSREVSLMTQSIHSPLADSTDLTQSQYFPMMDSEDAFNIPYDLSNSGGDDPGDDLRSAPSTPRALAPQGSPPVQFAHGPAQSTIAEPPDPWSSFERDAHSEPANEQLRRWGRSSFESEQEDMDVPAALGPGSEGPTPLPEEDLARSQMFSHEDAESMYMSAFSHTDTLPIKQAMPGAWDDSEPSSADNSPHAKSRAAESGIPEPEASAGPWIEPAASSNDAQQPTTESIHLSFEEAHSKGAHVEDKSDRPEDSEHNREPGVTEGVATPRGPTRLVKEILSLAAVSIYVPSNHDHVPMPSSSDEVFSTNTVSTSKSGLGRSVAPNVPGAFSIYEGNSSASTHKSSPTLQTQGQPVQSQPTEFQKDNSIEVILAPLDVQFDASISFLLAMVVSRILAILKEQGNKTVQKSTSSAKSATSFPDIRVSAEQISIQFLETLAGIADTPERMLNPSPASFASDALLTTTLRNLGIEVSRTEFSTVTSVDLKKFKFGYGNDDIISFDQRLQMRASVRDAFPSAGADISLKITQSPDSTRCEVKTLPLHVKLDLQRLDETFSWFGGLSSFLNMGSSMTLSASPTPRSPTRTAKKPRGVRFDAPIRADDKSAVSENKVNLRIGGIHLDLIGKDCSVVLDTSAVKLVNRDEGVGIGITKVQLQGPFMKRSMGDPPINATIMNTRIEYLMSPRDNDLERLLELIIPSKYKFDENDDEIMVDTLLRQRRKGGVMRLNFDTVDIKVAKIQQLQCLPALGEELARLGTVAKYLPEDDRPGILTLSMIRSLDLNLDVDQRFGSVQASIKDLEVGHITFPSLVALGLSSISVRRNNTEDLVGSGLDKSNHGPVLTMRMIPDAMEPVVKLRMRHINVEYRVPTIMDILDLAEDATPQDFEAQLAASVANLGEQAHTAITGRQLVPDSGKGKSSSGKPTKLDLIFRDCLIGMNPLGLTSKMVIALTDAQLEILLSEGDEAKALAQLNKASILLIDDVSLTTSPPNLSRRRSSNATSAQVVELCSKGYVDICYISAAKAAVLAGVNEDDGTKFIDVEVRDDLFVMETCADSTQTLIALANALQPPTPPNKVAKYRTKIVPVQDLLSSISADAFGNAEGAYDFDDDFGLAQELGGEDLEGLDLGSSGESSPLDVHSQFYDDGLIDDEPGPADSMMSERTTTQDTNDGVLLTNFSSQPSEMDDNEELVIKDSYFDTSSAAHGGAPRWISARNQYDQPKNAGAQRNPVTVNVRDVHVIWNLFDGYDWTRTREVITKAVEDVEAKALERRGRSDRVRVTADMDAMIEEEETVIGDFLFNSIYIGVPANRDPRELARNINEALNDNATETESIATTAMTATPSRAGSRRTKKRLKLNRSKRHKITFELKGINVHLVNFPESSGETQSSIRVRVKDLDVFDHVPTSTWKKFATYDQDAGERAMGTSMVQLELMKVKPIPDLAATEIVLTASVLPLRLHVDQDALDFITRFFEFKDASAPVHASQGDVPFIQRAEIHPIPVKLDFKPKRVDYAGLRSGHTTEFMNFVILDEARMVMKHTVVYGVTGFDRLGMMLNDIWMPDITRNQLPGVLAGLAPVRSLVNVGSGFKDLIEIPIKEYKKDGRIVRSIGKGAAAFAKTTGTEIVKLGAKMAVGTQQVLQGAEGMLVTQPDVPQVHWEEEEEVDNEETKQISLYADQPTGVVQGLRGAYSSLARDLNVARDAIIAVPGEIMESASAQGAAAAVLRRAPTIIFRPLIGSSKAIGQTLMGATNSLDPHNRRRAEEKYKKH